MSANSSLESHIEKLCIKVLDEKGWKTFKDIQVKALDQLSPIGAFITLTQRQININVSNDIYKAIDDWKRDEKLIGSSESVIEPLTYFAVVHEYGHHQYCPRTREDLQQVLEGIFEAVQGRECDAETIKGLCLNIHNMFSDTILNTINSRTDDKKESYREWLDNFYSLSGHYLKNLGVKRRMSKSFSLFLESNQFLCNTSEKSNESIHKKYFPRFFPGFQRYRKKLLNVFTGDEELTKKVLERSLSEEESENLVKRFKDNSLWKKMAYDYTNILYPFIKQESKQEQEMLDNSFSKEERQSQSQKKTSEKKDKSCDKQCDNNCKDKKRNPIEDILDKLLKNEKHVPYTSQFLAQFWKLDQLYKSRAGKIALYAEEQSRSSQDEEKMSVEEMPFEEFEPKDIDWASTRILTKNGGTKHVELYKYSNPLILPFESEEQPVGIPDLSFILDSSISMGFKPFEGEGQGGYHFAVLAFYSILNYLEKEGLAPLLNYHMINFSDTTYSSGWRNYSELMEVKKTLFDYQGNGTTLDPKALEDLRDNRKDNLLCFMLSDTGFNSMDNEAKIIEEVDKIIGTRSIGFYLFQLGYPSRFSKAMEERNIPVQYVKSAEDFMNKSIRFSKSLYGEIVKR
ncbi:hypothetical protein FJZ53_04450 [Candidatus Woesearchaeota archaeon]|nr:hypothetical protein [Candidatus Woesearchaeota archaeon]